MSAAKYLKGECQKCGGHLEFPAESIGMEIQCPHCGGQTELTLYTSTQEPLIPRRVIVWTIVAVLILVGGLIGTLMALGRAQRLLASQKSLLPANTAPGIPTPSTGQNEFQISPIRLETVSGSSLVYAVGTLKNDSGRERFGVRIDLDILDKRGERSGSATDYRQSIQPGGEWQFRALVNATNGSSVRVSSITEQR